MVSFLRDVCLLSTVLLNGVVASSLPGFVPTNEGNMNGDYVFSTTPGGTPGKFPKAYKDYPRGVEYFDVYSPPITTLYSQVWWSPLAPTKLPDEIVKKYNNTGMAIVGWEIDQVRRTATGDVSVPISASYNHHYVSQVIGAGMRFRKVVLDGPDDPRVEELKKQSGHGMIALDQAHYLAEQVRASPRGLSQHQAFSSANGGEYRKTYHGFSPSHALVVDSPTEFQISPMQIDTWNRHAMNISGPLPPKFVPGPLPRAAQSPPDARYSGLLECPMTTRLSKVIDGDYVARTTGSCEASILTFQECYHAAAATIAEDANHVFRNETASDPTRPAGCSMTIDPTAPLNVHVFFNSLATSTVACAQGATTVAGTTTSLVGVTITADKEGVQISLKGSAAVWYGVGFGAHTMADAPWTVVIDGTGAVTERKLANHAAGAVLPPSVKLVSNTVANGMRTVVLTRQLKGAGPDYFSFDLSSTSTTIPFITAVGSASAYAYHKIKTPSSLTLLPTGSVGACVCPEKPKPFGQATGQLQYHAVNSQKADTGSGSVGFSKNKCQPSLASDLIDQKNPTCDIRAYRGGQWACHHMWSLLDADQDIPWVDEPLVLHHKYRFWVQPYDKTYHTELTLGERVGSALLLGSPWEYDVPKCTKHIAGCSFANGTWWHTIKGSTMGAHTFAALNFHCHAPTCHSMEVYQCPLGTLLVDCNATIGKLICRQEPVYGGTGNPALHGSRFDEPGYIAIPDCFWGSAEFGLEAPVNFTGIPLHMVKMANATIGHYGEMAGGQPWVY